MTRGFTLLEAIVTLAILGVVAALAIPNLLPAVQQATLDGSGESVAAFLARARSEAMTTKRCVRVWIPSTATHDLVAERLNTFDCDRTPATLPGGLGIDGTARVWIEFARLRPDSTTLQLTLRQAPSSSTATAPAPGSVAGTPAGFPGAEIRFRPNGRVFSNDAATNLTDDDAVVVVRHPRLPTSDFKAVLVDGSGLICALPRGGEPAVDGAAPNFKCP
jgi:prepilin-type N-terminal cleavage/methylation domain-containing protein